MSAVNVRSPDTSPQPTTEARAPEPSMDDILASIRRIIADDQSRHAGASAAGNALRRPPPPMAPRPATPGAGGPGPAASAATTALAARRPPLVEPPRPGDKAVPQQRAAREVQDHAAAPTPTPQAPTPHVNPPMLPPDIALERSVLDEIASAGMAAALQARPTPLPPPHVAVEPTAVVMPSPPESPAMAVVASEPKPDLAPALEPPPSAAAAPPSPSSPESAVVDAQVAVEPVDEPLVSSAAEASVETSFNALATSVFLQNTGMIESMVRDMLKPMLRSWLDDNLPPIVERLVRIEIERVARGGRA